MQYEVYKHHLQSIFQYFYIKMWNIKKWETSTVHKCVCQPLTQTQWFTFRLLCLCIAGAKNNLLQNHKIIITHKQINNY